MNGVEHRFKPGGVLLALLVGVLLVGYAWTGRLDMLWAAAALTALAVVTAASVRLSATVLASSRVERKLAPAVAGIPVKVDVRVEASQALPPSRLMLVENPPTGFLMLDPPRYSVSLLRREARWSYEAYLLPGEWCWGPPSIVVEDILGLFEARLAVGGVECMRIPPRAIGGPRRTLEEAGLVGGRTPAGRGVGTVFMYVRDYTSDDDPRYIEWKATARTGKLAVKVFEKEEFASVTLVLALSPDSLKALPGATPYEAAVDAAAILGRSLVDAGAEVSVVACSSGPPIVEHNVKTVQRLAGILSRIKPPLDPGGWSRCLRELEGVLAAMARPGRLRVAVILGDPRGVDEASSAVGGRWRVVVERFSGGENPLTSAAKVARIASRMARGAV